MQATLHLHGKSLTLDVIGTECEGRVDLGVGRCITFAQARVATTGEHGTCTLILPAAPAPPVKKPKASTRKS